MGLIRKFLDASIPAKITVGILFLANLFNWIVFCMNDWGLMDTNPTNVDDEQGFGVWSRCGRDQGNGPDCVDLDGWRLPWYGAFQAFMVFAFVSCNVAFLFVILAVFVPQFVGNKETLIFCFASCIVAAVTYLISIIIFGVCFDETYDRTFDEEELYVCWDFAVVNTILITIAAIFALVAIRNGGKSVGDSSGGSGDDEEKRRKREEENRKKEERERQKQEEKRVKEEEKKKRDEEKQKAKEEEKRRKEEERRKKAKDEGDYEVELEDKVKYPEKE